MYVCREQMPSLLKVLRIDCSKFLLSCLCPSPVDVPWYTRDEYISKKDKKKISKENPLMIDRFKIEHDVLFVLFLLFTSPSLMRPLCSPPSALLLGEDLSECRHQQ